MAAPAKVDIKNLQGKWVMNKSLSDSADPVLALQGVGWLTRKAINLATVTQHLTQKPATGADGSPNVEVVIEQFASASVKGTTENRIMDWQYRGHSDWLFGTLQGRSRYTTIAALLEEAKGKDPEEEDAKFLAEGWLAETLDGEIVEGFVDNDGAKWTAWQIWGFAEIGGERRLTRRFAVRRKDKKQVVRIRLTYDWVGELE